MQDLRRAHVLAEARRVAVARRRTATALLGAAALLAVAPAAQAHDGSGRGHAYAFGHSGGDQPGPQRDTVAPAAPTASLPGGEIALPQTIHLNGENVRYTTDGSEPTVASTPYAGGISVTSALTIKAIAVDAAGNVSPVAAFAYTEKPVARVIQPVQTVVVDRPGELRTEVIREVLREVPATPVTRSAAAVAGIDRVSAPRRVSLRRARTGVAMTVSTKAGFLRATASRGAKVTARKRGAGFDLLFTARRTSTYKVTVAVPQATAKVITITVRRPARCR